jgi:hypothetical protein
VYLRDDHTVGEARQGLGRYWTFYHEERLHQALGYRTPAGTYRGVRTPPLVTGEGEESNEATKLNVFRPQHGLDNGVHLRGHRVTLQAPRPDSV